MKRKHLMAAEIFGYSYDNYEDHLGGNVRFDSLMPEDVWQLELALEGKKEIREVAKSLDVAEDVAQGLVETAGQARAVVDAANPAESFREAVRQLVEQACEKGMEGAEVVDGLVGQICYRAADFGFLLQQEGHRLEQYSRHLRREANCEYHEGYFEEPFRGQELGEDEA
jgi:hypothetical protein